MRPLPQKAGFCRLDLKIISGGQTGADRAALRWAEAFGVPSGGWCPKGRRAEDGIIPKKFPLRETPHAGWAERTMRNVRDSDATVIFSLQKRLKGGTLLTWKLARRMKKPLLHLPAMPPAKAALILDQFLRRNQVRILNVAGPRKSQEPSVGRYVFETLLKRIEPVG